MVRVLEGGRGERGGEVPLEPPVERGELPEDHPERPVVAHRAVDDEGQKVLVGVEPEERDAQQRPPDQVERKPGSPVDAPVGRRAPAAASPRSGTSRRVAAAGEIDFGSSSAVMSYR